MPSGWIRDLLAYGSRARQPGRARSHHVATYPASALELRGKANEPSRIIPTARSEEWEQSRLELAQARERIADLTRSQVELTSTIARLNELASTDVLTGLNNRRRFNEALEANFSLATRQRSSLSLIITDVDSFKSYNDTYGHLLGDNVLCVVAQQLLRCSTNYHVVARHGGEEFAVLLPAADSSQALDHAELLRSAIEFYPWPLRRVTASFGVATLRPTTTDPAELVEQADRALYYSKSHGRNRVAHILNIESVSAGASRDPRSGSYAGAPPAPDRKSAGDPDIASPTARRGQIATPATVTNGRPPRNRSILESSGQDELTDALDRFVHELWEGRKATHSYRTALSVIQAGIGAGLVFVWSERGDQCLENVGYHAPSHEWCSQVAETLSAELPQGGLWNRSDGASGLPSLDGIDPSAAVIVPVESSRKSWFLALRFGEDSPFVPSELRLVRMICRLQLEKQRYAHVYDDLKETLFGVVRCLSTAIDAKDPYTCGHSERVARIAVRLGKEMRLSKGEISDLYLAGLLHDVGKIGIRDEVLCKAGPLTPEEFVHIQEHPVIGERIIANVSRLSYIRPGVRGHHERFDGEGYPDGLVGQAIPLMARILAVSDSCDAMMSARRYRPELTRARIEQIFIEGAGTQWDPAIVEHFFACRLDLYAVFQRGLGQSVYMAVERAVSVDPQDNPLARSMERIVPALKGG